MSLSKAFTGKSLAEIYTGSKAVEAAVAAKTIATQPRQIPIQVVEDDGKVFPSPAVQMTPQKTVFAADTPMSPLPDPTLYQGKTVLTKASIANTGIAPPQAYTDVDFATAGPMSPHGEIDGIKPQLWQWALFINHGKSSKQNGIWRYYPEGWTFIGRGDDDKLIRVMQGSKAGKLYKKTPVGDGTIEYIDVSTPVIETITAPVTEAIKTATGFELKPIYIIGAVLLLVGLWFAWKKGYLKV